MGRKGRERRLGKDYKKISEIRYIFGDYLRREYTNTSKTFFNELMLK